MDIEAFHFPEEEFTSVDRSLVEIYKEIPGEFESLNRLACQICNTPVSLVNMLDQNFQYTVSNHGDWSDFITPKKETACQFTVEKDKLLVIEDTLEDERASKIKELTEDASIRFYAGVPLKSDGGQRFGAFCVIDYEPKVLSDGQKQALKDLAREVELRVKLYKQKERLKFKNKKLSQAAAFLKNSADVLLVVDSIGFKIVKSSGAEGILDVSDTEIIGKSLLNIIDQINIKKHIKNWIGKQATPNRLGIPVKINIDSNTPKWLNLTFTKYEEFLLVTGRDITKEQLSEQELKDSLEEKEVLLSEVHHRVKNNLAVVSSLLQLERFRSENEEIQNVLYKSEMRITTIAKIHELLYKTQDFKNVDIHEYLQQLINYIKESHAVDNKNIAIDITISELSINVNMALPMGLIINELITNAIKHAFKDKDSGIVSILVAEADNNTIHFKVSDNGTGIELAPSDLKEGGNLGFTLINTLTNQLGADLEIEANSGTTFSFTFTKDDRKGSISAMN